MRHEVKIERKAELQLELFLRKCYEEGWTLEALTPAKWKEEFTGTVAVNEYLVVLKRIV